MKKFLHNLLIFLFSLIVSNSNLSAQACAFPDGNTLSFDGSNDYINIPYNSGFNLRNSLTLEAWVNISTGSRWNAIVGNLANSGAFYGYQLYVANNNKVWLQVGQSYNNWDKAESSTTLNLNTWYHIAGTFDGTTIKVYINGVLAGSKVWNYNITNGSSSPLRIGSRPDATPMNCAGKIDEVRIWNTVKTASDLNINKSLSLLGTETGLVAYYRFNQGSPSGNNSSVTTLINSVSSSANTGSLSGFALSGASSNWVASAGDAIDGPSEVSLGNTISLTYPVTGGVWSSSNTSVATVSSSGVVTGNASGTAQISYTHSGGCVNSTVISVNATPTLSVVGSLSAFESCQGTPSASQSFTLTGQNLTSSVSLASLSGFEYSTDNSSFSSTLSLTPTSGSISQAIYVRLSSSASSSPSGNISITSNGAISETVSVNGSVSISPTAGSLSGNQSICISGTTTFSSNAPQVQLDRGLHFVGGTLESNSDYVTVNSSFPVSSGDFTIEAWVNPGLIDNQYHGFFGSQLATGPNTSNRDQSMWIGPNGSLHTDYFTGGVRYDIQTDNNFFTTNTWTHVAWVKEGSTFKLYKNGEFVTSRTAPANAPAVNGFYWFGRVDNFFTGALDEFRIWNVARTPFQIQLNMNKQIAAQTNLVAYYDFNQGTENGTNTGLATLLDRTTSALNGTLSGFTLSGTTSNWTGGAMVGGTWTSGNTSVATIHPLTGVITSVSAGTATMTYTVAGITPCADATATRVVTVTAPTTAGSISGTLSVCAGSTTQLTSYPTSNALDFDGTDDYVSLPAGVYFDDNTFTIEGWVYVKGNPAWHRLIDFGNGAADNTVTFALSQGTTGYPALHLYSTGGANSRVDATQALPQNQWVHIAAVRNGTFGAIYVNGVLSVSVNNLTENTANVNRTRCYIGRSLWSGDGYTNAKINEVRIWNIARTQTEIANNMNADVSQETGIVALYKFDQGLANGPNATATSLTDYASGGNDGTLNNFALTGSSSNWTLRGTANNTGGTWTSSNTAVATVSNAGLVTGVTAGTATITYTVTGTGGCANATATSNVTVNTVPQLTSRGAAAGSLSTSALQIHLDPANSTSYAGTGTAWNDLSGNNRNTTLNGVTYNSSNGGNLVFAGSGTATSNATHAMSLQNGYTLVQALKLTDYSGGTFQYNSLPDFYYINYYLGGSDKMRWETHGGNAMRSNASLPLNNWVIVSSTFSGVSTPGATGTAKIYINGVLDNTGTLVSTSAMPANYFQVGEYAGNMNGSVGATLFYNRELTASEIAENFNYYAARYSLPTVSSGSELTACSGTVFTYTPTSDVTGATFSWSRAAITGISNAASTGTGGISETLVNTTSSPVTVTYVYTTTANGCSSTTNISVVVYPTPAALTGPSALCIGTNGTLASTTTGGTWTSSDPTVATVSSSGVVTPLTAGTTTITYSLNVGGSCTNLSTTKVITVTAPPPSAGTLSGIQTVFVGGTTTFASTVAGGTWSSSNTAVATVNASTGVVTGVTAGTATITYTNTGTGACSSTVLTSTRAVTVYACPVIPALSSSAYPVCAESNFTLTAAGLSGMSSLSSGIIFKYSTTALTNPYVGGTVIATVPFASLEAGNTIARTTTSLATGGTYYIYAILSTTPGGTGCLPYATTTLVVNPKGQVTLPANSVVCAGASVAAQTLSTTNSGGTTTYAWTNSATSIGLAASGTGNIPAFTATNTGAVGVTSTITVTPTYTDGGLSCAGPASTYTITVNPVPVLTAVSNQVICAGSTGAVNFTSSAQSTTINWTNSNTAIGLGASGSGNISYIATNSGPDQITSTITATPSYTSLSGAGRLNYTIYSTHGGTGNTSQYSEAPNSPAEFDALMNTANSNTVVHSTGTAAASLLFANGVSGSYYGAGAQELIAAGISVPNNGEYYALKVSGTLIAAETGTYTFGIRGDDAVEVRIDGAAVAAHYGLHGIGGYGTGTISLVAGQSYSIEMRMQEYGGGEGVELVWKRPSQSSFSANLSELSSSSNTCTGDPITFTVAVNPVGQVNAVSNQVLCNGSATSAVTFVTTNNGLISSGGSQTASSGTIAVDIPDASATGVASTIPVTLPTGAVINNMRVNFNITHTWVGDLSINLVAPNGQVLNLVNRRGGSGSNFVNTTISSTGTTTLTSASAPFTGTYAADAASGVGATAYPSTAANFAALYGTTNGNWRLVIRDHAGGDVGTLTGWSLSFDYAVQGAFGTNMNWTNSASSIGLAASGTGHIPSFTATNTGTTPVVSTVTVTPVYFNSGTNCPGTPITYTYTVNPTPTVNTVATQTFCAGTAATVAHTGAVTGTVYSWTNSNTAIGLPASGTGSLSFTPTNTGTTPITATITVTPSYTNAGVTCTGTPKTYTIMVNPVGQVNTVTSQVLCNGSATTAVAFSTVNGGGTVNPGTPITASSGTIAVVIPDANAAGVAHTIPVTLPPTSVVTKVTANFNITHTWDSDLSINLVAPNGQVLNLVNRRGGSGDNFTNTTISPTATTPIASGTAPFTGTYLPDAAIGAGSTSFASTAANFDALYSVGSGDWKLVLRDHAGGDVGTLTGWSLIFEYGALTPAVTSYAWTNNTPSVGLAASGTGNIASFTATNTTAAPVTSTVTVTPTYTNNGVGCAGTPITYTYTVNPTPTVNAVSNQTVCRGSSTAAVTFTGATTGTVYTWTSSNAAVGLTPSTGTATVPSFTATNTTAAPITTTITVTPSYTNAGVTCTGTPRTFTITVNPIPTVNAVASFPVCHNSPVSVNFTGATTGTVYSWTNTNPAIGLAASGTGNLSFTATNPATGGAPITATITVTPSYTNNGVTCVGTPTSFTITVNPLPVVSAGTLPSRICISDTLVKLNGTPVGGSWSGIGTSGMNFIPTATAIGSYALTYTYADANGCVNRATITANVQACEERNRDLDNEAVILYPNPNSGQFNLRINSTRFNVLGMKVYNAAGQLVSLNQWRGLVYGRVIPVNLTNLAAGTYMVRLYYGDGMDRGADKTYQIIIAR